MLNKEYCKQLHDLTEKPQENAVEESKVEEQVEEVSVEEEVAVPCAESQEVVDNSDAMTQENAVKPKKKW